MLAWSMHDEMVNATIGQRSFDSLCSTQTRDFENFKHAKTFHKYAVLIR